MAQERTRQKKLEKHKRKREQARQKSQHRAPLSPSERRRRLLELAAACPAGPCFVTPSYRSADEDLPPLVHVIVSRRLPDGDLLSTLLVVDRTCLGVKDAMLLRPMAEQELQGELRHRFGHTGGVEDCELLLAQSIVFHALDYAAALGLKPHRDFLPALLGRRPEALLDTPLARPRRPVYLASGEDPNPDRTCRTLAAAVGPGGYYFGLRPLDSNDPT